MALKRLTAGTLLAVWMLCGCGNRVEAAVVRETGSAQPVQQEQLEQPVQPEGSAQIQANDPQQEKTLQESPALPLEGVVICLDPGHGITSASALEQVSPLSDERKAAYVSGAQGNSQSEQELNLAVARLTCTQLQELGAEVVLTRQTEQATVSNIERAQMANDRNADLCIRIHADGADDASVSGMSMQVPAGQLLGTPEIEQPSAQAAEIILQAVTQATGARSRGLVQRSDLTGFNWSEVPCILLEMGFLSNAEEDALLATEDYRQKIAAGIAQGVCHWVDSLK